jgi:hypothetical protein
MLRFTLLFAFILPLSALAQWSNDPANPKLVCDEADYQSDVQMTTDGNGGVIVYWRDRRNDGVNYQVYGQRYDPNGNALWEPTGRLLIDPVDNIGHFAAYFYEQDNRLLIVWYDEQGGYPQADDRLYVNEFDVNGNRLWANDLTLGFEDANGALSAGYYSHVALSRYGDNVLVLMQVNTYGYDRLRVTSFHMNGFLVGPVNGIEKGPLDVGIAWMTADQMGGAYLFYSTGNGAGAHVYTMHINFLLQDSWGEWVNATAGSGGLNYQFAAVGDPTGAVFTWEGYGDGLDIFTRRVSIDGSYGWNGDIKTVVNAPGTQGQFNWLIRDNKIYIFWRDARPGVSPGLYDIYTQKYDINGDFYYATNGVPVSTGIQNYDPAVRLSWAENNSIVVSHVSSIGLISHKINDSGVQEWAPNGILSCTPANNPSSTILVQRTSGNRIYIAWDKFLNFGGRDGIYINLVHEFPVEEEEEPCLGDFDGNGTVATNDLLLLLAGMGCNANCGDLDLTNDGVVSTNDLLSFLALFGTECNPIVIPE